jgi:crossover junction endodeoxyribonuclease RuvC
MIILGVDPGLAATGYGIVEAEAWTLAVLTAGAVSPPPDRPLAERLGRIHAELSSVIRRYHPAIMVLEQLFTHHRHVTTAALMGHARGVACLTASDHGLRLAEYRPTHVKKALTGHGHASKEQVARMVAHWLGGADPAWSVDATDALALAIVHAHQVAMRWPAAAGTEEPRPVRAQAVSRRCAGRCG